MADHECENSSSASTSSLGEQIDGPSNEPSTKIVISNEPSYKEDDVKEDDADCKGMYTAGTRGFPPSRFASRVAFGGPHALGGNPFAAKPTFNRPSMDEGSPSWPGLTPSKLGGSFGSPAPSPLSSKFALKPSAFGSPSSANSSPMAAAPKTSFPLNPSRLGNTFENKASLETCNMDEEEEEEKKKDEASEAVEKANTPASVKFVPLGTPGGSTSVSNESSSANVISTPSSFVFGQNLRERVVESNTPASRSGESTFQEPSSHEQNGTCCEEAKEAVPATNGLSTGEMLFSAVLKKDTPGDASNDLEGTPAKSLSEAAREYEESRAVKRKFDEVEVKTGEEEETNVLQISCKLHTFDKSKGSWAERGRGQLRLNDKVENHTLLSRVIMRTHGSLRVVLNTKVWPEMVVDRANVKSVRFTAMDDDQIKVFLVTATPKDAENLYTALERRVTAQRIKTTSTPTLDADVPSPDAANSDVEQTRSCMDASNLPADEEPSAKKGRGSIVDEHSNENSRVDASDTT
ncbi:ran-binding protein 3 [Neocloeon triangulifer]|uniref:ran-binding protein 3 n=1 Tax=Neocloeon triangulifer TaxID=2078957 RepID=UPI00286F1FB3|nr:ran-binding protein 3 [Neocloeon triangulifer]